MNAIVTGAVTGTTAFKIEVPVLGLKRFLSGLKTTQALAYGSAHSFCLNIPTSNKNNCFGVFMLLNNTFALSSGFLDNDNLLITSAKIESLVELFAGDLSAPAAGSTSSCVGPYSYVSKWPLTRFLIPDTFL